MYLLISLRKVFRCEIIKRLLQCKQEIEFYFSRGGRAKKKSKEKRERKQLILKD